MVAMRNLMPAAVAALSFGTVWTAGSWGLEALIGPSATASSSAAEPQADPSRPMRGMPLQDHIGAKRSATGTCEDDGRARGDCLRQERSEPPKPAGAYRPAKQLGPPRQYASHRPPVLTDYS